MTAPQAAMEQVFDALLALESPNVAWLRRAGPIAKRLNEDARKDER